MRLGIFGGSFDPPHVGHLLPVSDAYETLGLDHLIVVPAGSQPLKAGEMVASGAQRLAMVRLAVAGDPRFEVDPIEIDRAGLSYTVDTLQNISDRHAGAELYFLAGADLLASFDRWREPDRIRQLARLVVMPRADGREPSPDVGDMRFAMRDVPGAEPARLLETRRIDVSSTEIRARVRAGRSIHGFVPDAVGEYIASAGLYR